MASVTLEDVTAELMVSNETLGFIKSDVQLMTEYMDLTHNMLRDQFTTLIAAISGDALANLEKAREEAAFQKKLLEALKKPEKPNQLEEDDGGVPGLLAMLAIGLGAAVGAIQGQLKAIKLFVTQFSPKFLKNMFGALRKRVLGMVMGLAMQVSMIVKDVKTAIGSAMLKFTTFFTDTFAKFKNSKIGTALSKSFKTAGKWLKAFADPFIDAFKMIKGWVGKSGAIGKIGSSLSSMGKIFGSLGGLFKTASVIAKRIFLPLTILMSVFDTVKKSFEEGEKKGTSGYISGAIKGLVNSLITVPLDLVKNGVAWLIKQMGFDEEAAAVKEFSFTESFNKIVDAIFDVVGKAVEWVKLLFKDPKAALQKMWNGIMEGVKDIGDWIAKQIDKAVTWIMSKLGIENDFGTEGDEFSIKEEITKLWEKIKAWFKEKLDALTPDWLRDLMTTDKTPEQIRAETQRMSELNSDDYGDATSEPVQTLPVQSSIALDQVTAENNAAKTEASSSPVIINNNNINQSNVDQSTNGAVTVIPGSGPKKVPYEMPAMSNSL